MGAGPCTGEGAGPERWGRHYLATTSLADGKNVLTSMYHWVRFPMPVSWSMCISS